MHLFISLLLTNTGSKDVSREKDQRIPRFFLFLHCCQESRSTADRLDVSRLHVVDIVEMEEGDGVRFVIICFCCSHAASSWISWSLNFTTVSWWIFHVCWKITILCLLKDFNLVTNETVDLCFCPPYQCSNYTLLILTDLMRAFSICAICAVHIRNFQDKAYQDTDSQLITNCVWDYPESLS